MALKELLPEVCAFGMIRVNFGERLVVLGKTGKIRSKNGQT